jgi:membrane fusion protein, hemolysin D
LSLDESAQAAIKQFQSETDAIREAPEPVWARMTVFLLGGMLASLLVVALVTSMDRVVISQAGSTIVPLRAVNVYQALDASIIKTIDVREGDRVEAGQLLATLDPTFAAADVQQLKSQIASLEAQIARDEAELAGKPPVFPETSDREKLKYQALQMAFYEQRIAQYKEQVNSYDAKSKQLQATLVKLKTDVGTYLNREKIALKIEDMRTTLADNGTGSQLNMLISQDARLEVTRALESARNSIIEAQHQLEATKADREAFIQQSNAWLSQDLVTARNNLDTARSQLDKAVRRQDLVQWTAQEPAIVLTKSKLSVGSVLKEGEVLFTLMPLNAPLEGEARISSRDVGFVRVGDPCTLKIDAFQFIEHGWAEGKVRWISEGAFTVDENNKDVEAYYKLRCTIAHTNFRNVPENFRLIPGMTMAADIKVGSRSVAMYMLRGAARGLSEAMREP